MMEEDLEMSGVECSEKSSLSKVQFKELFKLRYRMRIVHNKGAFLILVWSFLVTNLGYCISYSVSRIYSSLVYVIILTTVGLTIPLAGWLADVRYGRYKIIQWSLWTMWISSLLLTSGLVILQLLESQNDTVLKLVMSLLIPLGIGYGGFQANIIQFGVDQLPDASSCEVRAFVAWYTWTYISSQVTASLTLYYVSSVQYKLLSLALLICGNLSLTVSMNLIFKNVLIKEPGTQNPFKMVYKVIMYALKNKRPRQRSAFTYWEDDIPSHIDLGKRKYGGPFTTEQVEDVKTLFRVLFVVFVIAALYGTIIEQYSVKIYLRRMFILDHSSLSDYVYYDFYFIAGAILIPLNEVLIYPFFNRCLPSFKSYWKCILGVILYFVRYLILMTLLTYTRQELSRHSSNTSVINPCIFYSHYGPLSGTNDGRWVFLLDGLSATSTLFFYIGGIEFYCAQVPYTMKGLVIGIFYSLACLFMLLSQAALFLPFKAQSLAWGNGTLSCGFWYLFTRITYMVIVIIAAALVMRYYKTRKREDLLPNEHVFAEAYYSRET